MTGTALATVLGGAIGGGIVGWWLGRRRTNDVAVRHEPMTAASGGVMEPQLLPDPALEWLRRAHGALGVWIAELDPEEEGPRAERLVDAERLSVAQIMAVDRRLERARDREESGAEQMDGAWLVFAAGRGMAAGLLVPGGADADGGAARVAQAQAQAQGDVQRLLEALQRKPQVVALAQARTRDVSVESAASVGFRLAYQLDRMLGAHGLRAEVVVGVAETDGARVVGVSGYADRRLLDRVLPLTSELARVARGEGEAGTLTGDPFGGVVVDRRERSGASALVPIRAEGRILGAVSIGIAADDVLTDSVRTEIDEMLADAGPRLLRAKASGVSRAEATPDPLTGLPDRQGFAAMLVRREWQTGVLIVLDVDRLAALNDALGAVAGDAALAHVAHLLRGQIRGDDIPARVDGGRFAVWVPGADRALGIRVAERLLTKVNTVPWAWRGRPWPLAVSAGVVVRGRAEDGVDDGLEVLVNKAVAVVDRAKQNGGNRVETAG